MIINKCTVYGQNTGNHDNTSPLYHQEAYLLINEVDYDRCLYNMNGVLNIFVRLFFSELSMYGITYRIGITRRHLS